MWRCVLHGRVSSFFRPSESGVREFFGAAILAGLGSFLGGVWLFRICCGEVYLVWRCVLHGRVSSFFRPSESGVREFFGAAVLAGLGSFLGGVWLFRICCGEVGFGCGGAFCTVEFSIVEIQGSAAWAVALQSGRRPTATARVLAGGLRLVTEGYRGVPPQPPPQLGVTPSSPRRHPVPTSAVSVTAMGESISKANIGEHRVNIEAR